MRHYSLLAYVIDSAIPPGYLDVRTMPDTERVRTMNVLAALPAHVASASNGMGTVDVTIRVVPDTITEDLYFTLGNDDWYPSPVDIAIMLGDHGSHDFYAAFVATAQAPDARFLGYTLTVSFYVNTSEAEQFGTNLADVTLHELGHAIAYHMEVVGGIDTWPVCAANTGPSKGIHCAEDYGYADNNSGAWLGAFFSGTVGGDLGMTQEAWDELTPTELGNRDQTKPAAILPSRYGNIGPLRVPIEGGD